MLESSKDITLLLERKGIKINFDLFQNTNAIALLFEGKYIEIYFDLMCEHTKTIALLF